MQMGDELPQSKPDGFDSSLGEGASGETGHFTVLPETLPPCQRPHLRGGWHRAAMTGGVRSPFCALPQAAKQCIIGAEHYNAGNPG